MPRHNGNPLANPRRDSVPLERLVAYHYEDVGPVDETPWPQVWMQRIHTTFNLRRREAESNYRLNRLMLELLRAAQEVSVLLKYRHDFMTKIIATLFTFLALISKDFIVIY